MGGVWLVLEPDFDYLFTGVFTGGLGRGGGSTSRGHTRTAEDNPAIAPASAVCILVSYTDCSFFID